MLVRRGLVGGSQGVAQLQGGLETVRLQVAAAGGAVLRTAGLAQFRKSSSR